jgi:tryptophan synthase alpha chain
MLRGKKMDFTKKALIVYITAGFPDMDFTKKAILLLQSLGVSAIEVGIPYSDPVADGPVIAQAGHKSLEKGTNMDGIFKAVSEIKGSLTVPLYFMSYYSPVYTYGEDKFIKKCLESGVTGAIIPDLSLDEGRAFYQKEKKEGLDPILLVFPNTAEKKIKEIASVSGSFIYYVNLFGTTGVRTTIPADAYKKVEAVKKASGKPVCAGFGVSGREDFEKLSRYADGVIIGSAVVKCILENESDPAKALKDMENFIRGILK